MCRLHRLAATGGKLLATGGTDGTIKVGHLGNQLSLPCTKPCHSKPYHVSPPRSYHLQVWDLVAQYYTHNLRAPGSGVATVVRRPGHPEK